MWAFGLRSLQFLGLLRRLGCKAQCWGARQQALLSVWHFGEGGPVGLRFPKATSREGQKSWVARLGPT